MKKRMSTTDVRRAGKRASGGFKLDVGGDGLIWVLGM
jgi:hypothetical protein